MRLWVYSLELPGLELALDGLRPQSLHACLELLHRLVAVFYYRVERRDHRAVLLGQRESVLITRR